MQNEMYIDMNEKFYWYKLSYFQPHEVFHRQYVGQEHCMVIIIEEVIFLWKKLVWLSSKL